MPLYVTPDQWQYGIETGQWPLGVKGGLVVCGEPPRPRLPLFALLFLVGFILALAV